jgi:DNA repair protein SbcD/Mre11
LADPPRQLTREAHEATMSQPFRFVHASDFHLERPLAGLAETPAHLADLFVDAPYTSAERVFDLAVSELADFLVLAGDVVNVDRAGPRAVAFLVDQFERLADRNIAVYWAGGAGERRGPWPSDLKLPDNVRAFAGGAPQPLVHLADGDPLAVLVGRASASGDKRPQEAFARPKGGLFSIGVSHRPMFDRRSAKLGIDYWACGGSHRRRRAAAGRSLLVCSGSPQGRLPAEQGSHGAIIVDVDEQATIRTRFAATDSARFRSLRVEIDPAAPRNEQERVLAERVELERARGTGIDLLLRWQIVTARTVGTHTAREAWAREWLGWLRQEFADDSPAAWSVSVEVVTAAAVQATTGLQDGSLLSDFLAQVAQLDERDGELPLETLLPESQRAGALADLTRIPHPRAKARLLAKAADLGRELLGAEEPAP